MINEEKIVLAEKNIVGICKVLKGREYLSDTWIFIQGKLANELAKTADEIAMFEGIQKIQWRAKNSTMGMIGLEPKRSLWKRVYNINDGNCVFIERAAVPNKIIWIE